MRFTTILWKVQGRVRSLGDPNAKRHAMASRDPTKPGEWEIRVVTFEADNFTEAAATAQAALLHGWSHRPHEAEVLTLEVLTAVGEQVRIIVKEPADG